MTYTTYLMADTANGVQVIDLMDYPEAEIMAFCDFADSLKNLGDGETIFTVADHNQLDQLKVDYAVN